MESSGDSPGMLGQLDLFTSLCRSSSHGLSSKFANRLKWQLKGPKGKCSKREKVEVMSPFKGQSCSVFSAHYIG